MRCKITKKTHVLVDFLSKISQTPKNLLSSMCLSRVGTKSETDQFFRPYRQ